MKDLLLPDPNKYALFWIPKSGLFYDGGVFLDGSGRRIRWERKITIYRSHARAETAKVKILAKFPNAKGELILIPVSIQEAKSDERAETLGGVRESRTASRKTASRR